MGFFKVPIKELPLDPGRFSRGSPSPGKVQQHQQENSEVKSPGEACVFKE